jgi:hypothetical protein
VFSLKKDKTKGTDEGEVVLNKQISQAGISYEDLPIPEAKFFEQFVSLLKSGELKQ